MHNTRVFVLGDADAGGKTAWKEQGTGTFYNAM
jgi:hypothetical protein